MSTPGTALLARRHVLGLGAAGVLGCAACGGRAGQPASVALELARADVPRLPADPAAARSAAAGVQDLAGGLLAGLHSSTGNLVVSPASIALALGMTAEGARGTTAVQMGHVLGLPAARAGQALGALQLELADRSQAVDNGDGTTTRVELDLANAVWAQRGVRWERPFLDSLGGHFGAGVDLADVGGDPAGTAAQINGWVAGQTHDKIRQLLDPDTLDPSSRMVLVNAAYLKAPWQTPFETGATKPAPFERLDGSRADVPSMVGTVPVHRTAGAGWRAVCLPYAGGRLALAVVVPDRGRFEQVVAGAGGSWLRRLLAGFATSGPRSVEVQLPRWSARLHTDLVPVLSALGMPLAFDPERADFSGMTTQEQLYVRHVAHEAWISVDEAGTEAAAATAAVVDAMALGVAAERFVADRPFLVVLHDVPTGAPLFVGTVVDPALTSS